MTLARMQSPNGYQSIDGNLLLTHKVLQVCLLPSQAQAAQLSSSRAVQGTHAATPGSFLAPNPTTTSEFLHAAVFSNDKHWHLKMLDGQH